MFKNLASKLNKQIKKVNVNSIIQNKVVLYIVGIFSLLYVLFLANQRDFNSVFVFAIVGFVLSFFTKNMIIILVAALLFTHFIKFTIYFKKEGMENKKKEGLENKKKEGLENKKKEGMDHDGEEDKEEDDDEPKLDTNEIDVEPKQTDMTEEEKMKKQQEYDKLKKEFVEFQSIQKDILKNMQEIDPLLSKAENFINKFEHYKKDKQTK